jgi:adenylosuccinate lyase
LIDRYSRPEMTKIWAQDARFKKMLEVEIAVAEVQSRSGLIPKKAAHFIRTKSKFSVERIHEIEKTTKHDVIAFVTNVAENVGEYGRFVHFGLTSSDVLDTALSLQIRDGLQKILSEIKKLEAALLKKIRAHVGTLCAGRTHGMHAEPTSFGYKLAGFLAETRRNRTRVEEALSQSQIIKLSGAVGTYSSLSEEVEVKVGRILKLKPETIATQVIPRDRHAQIFNALAVLSAGIERLAIELRHLQRTELSEVIEAFSPGQKGSSAMPHKKNPISAENLTGCARLMRSYQQAAMEDIALWHERDISHSSVERVIFGDAFILCDYMLSRMTELISGLYVNDERMLQNMTLSGGQLFSSHLLLALVEKSFSREQAYAKVQALSHSMKASEQLKDKALSDPEVLKAVGAKQIEKIFSGATHKIAITKSLKRFLKSLKN